MAAGNRNAQPEVQAKLQIDPGVAAERQINLQEVLGVAVRAVKLRKGVAVEFQIVLGEAEVERQIDQLEVEVELQFDHLEVEVELQIGQPGVVVGVRIVQIEAEVELQIAQLGVEVELQIVRPEAEAEVQKGHEAAAGPQTGAEAGAVGVLIDQPEAGVGLHEGPEVAAEDRINPLEVEEAVAEVPESLEVEVEAHVTHVLLKSRKPRIVQKDQGPGADRAREAVPRRLSSRGHVAGAEGAGPGAALPVRRDPDLVPGLRVGPEVALGGRLRGLDLGLDRGQMVRA